MTPRIGLKFLKFLLLKICKILYGFLLEDMFIRVVTVFLYVTDVLVIFFIMFLKVGLLDEEKILPLGKDITAVGVCRFKDGLPEIKSCDDLPYFL